MSLLRASSQALGSTNDANDLIHILQAEDALLECERDPLLSLVGTVYGGI